MQYLGSKARIASRIAAVINDYRAPGQVVWDAFCGGLSVAAALEDDGPVVCSDVHAPLIALYSAVQSGWAPPATVSREAWEAAKLLPDSDPLKAFCGFGCSYGGKWFGGYARPRLEPRTATSHGGVADPAVSSYRSVLRDARRDGLRFECLDFLDIEPAPTDRLLYCDPPYLGTTGYDGAPPFDRERFRARVLEWARHTLVFVSEYELPFGELIWSAPLPLLVKSGSGESRLERLYLVTAIPPERRYRRPPLFLM